MPKTTEPAVDLQQQKIFEAQLALLYGGLRVALSITFLVSVFLAMVMWSVVQHQSIIIWITAVLALSLARAISYGLYKRRQYSHHPAQYWYRIFNVGVLLAGLLWCASLIWLFPDNSVKHQTFIMFALIGMCSGAVTTLSFRKGPALLFITPISIAIGWRFVSEGDTWGVGLTAALVLYFIGLVISSGHIYRSTLQSIQLRLNADLQSRALEASKQKLRAILDTEADAFFLYDANGHIIDVNHQACISLGYSKDELLKLKIADIGLEPGQLKWDELEQGKTATFTGMHRQKDGSRFPVEVRIGVLYEAGEKRYSVLARDISERKQTEDALYLSEERARAQYKGIPVPTYTWQLKGDDFELVDFNDAAEAYTRGMVKKALGNRLSAMYADMPEIQQNIWECYKQKKSIQQQMPYYYQSLEQTRYLDVKYAYIPDDIVMIHTEDITERINAEKELHEKQAQLQEAQRIAQLGNWDWDLETGEINWSDEVFHMLGYVKGRDESNQENFIKAMHPDDLKIMYESEQRAMQGEKYFDDEWRMYTTSGNLIYVHLRGERIFDEQGKPVRMIGTMQDITERKQAEILKNEFISSVSHEIRTPLTSIMGSLSIINSGRMGTLPEELDKLVKIANDNSQRLLTLINDILDVAKIESGEFRLNLTSVDLVELVEEAVALNEGYANKYMTNIKIDNQLSGPLQINIDKERIIQVMNNLLSNAMKFTRPETEIEVSITRNGKNARVAVKDCGEGIDPAFIPHVFKRFSQSDASNTRKTGGTGLGLNITRQIIDAHNGAINFETGAQGSTFYFDLPV